MFWCSVWTCWEAIDFSVTVALVAVCWLKGEPLRWRWDDDKRARH
jgi:hypothetical protein